MNQTPMLQQDYLDILFTNRNKAYGGYVLRKNYPQRALQAIGLVMLLGALPAVFLSKQEKNITLAAPVIERTIDLTKVKLPDIKPVIPEKPIEVATTKAAIAAFAKPEIVQDDKVLDNKLSEVKDLKDKIIGTENQDGEATKSDVSNAIKHGLENNIVMPTTPPPPPPAKPERYVEIMPAFSGDLRSFLAKNLRYPAAARENNIAGRVQVEFVVNEDGAVSNVRVVRGIGGGCDEEAMRVVRQMPLWTPGRQGNMAVKVLMILPIVFELN